MTPDESPRERAGGRTSPDRMDVGRGFVSRSLCPQCAHVKIVSSEKGATFFLCRRAQSDSGFPKYPPQPVVACTGFER